MHNYFAFLNDPASKLFWFVWAVMLVWQNYAFTEVSRARSSGSLKRHAKAALMSNGVWFLQSLFVYSAFLKILSGQYGIWKAIAAALFYTLFTMSGSIYAHYRALKKEKGSSAVGANKKYAQIPVEEWAGFQQRFTALVSRVGAAETHLSGIKTDVHGYTISVTGAEWERIKRELAEAVVAGSKLDESFGAAK